MDIGSFINSNNEWLVPLITIFFTICIKISAKPDKSKLKKEDWSDFGFDMSIISMIIIISHTKNNVGFYLCAFILATVIIITNIVRRIGIGEDLTLNWWGIILPDLVGIVALIIAVLFAGGYIK